MDRWLFLTLQKKLAKFFQPNIDMFCLSRKPSIEKICFPTSPLGVRQARRLDLQLNRHTALLCKPPLDHHFRMVKPFVGQPPRNLHDDNPMVAPISKIAMPPNTSFSGSPLHGHVSKLPGGVHECAKMAPTLHHIIRNTLVAKEVQSEDIDTFSKK